MSLPRGDEYYSAIQTPKTAFQDIELKACSVEINQLGLPKPYSGGFTTTYHLYKNNQHWAVRCFTKEILELQRRYKEIGLFFEQNPNDFFVKTTFLENGIRINTKGQFYPIIKMQWLDGEALNIFISKNINNKSILSQLLPEFRTLVQRLKMLGIAHGDMQHGNIIIKKNGQFYLIDYDGMYVPQLLGLKTNEIGHVNYQHPLRNGSHYDATIDRFSSIVLYLGLLGVSVDPQLWKKYDNSENILFSRDDFIYFDKSSLLTDLASFPQLSTLVERFKGVCRLEFDKIPTLDDFIDGNFNYPKVTSPVNKPITMRSQYTVIDGLRTDLLLMHIGERINIIGVIAGCSPPGALTKNNESYMFLNFGGRHPNQTFTLVLWSDALDAFKQSGKVPNSYLNKWVSVTGVIGRYRKENKPQMVIQFPSQIQILSSDEAKQRLPKAAQPIQPILTPVSSPSTHSLKTGISTNKIHDVDILNNPNVEIFNNLYKDKTATSAPKTYPSVTYTPTSPLPRPPPNKTPAKKESNVFYGILFSIIFGSLGFAVMGFLGILVGIVIGYQIGKRL